MTKLNFNYFSRNKQSMHREPPHHLSLPYTRAHQTLTADREPIAWALLSFHVSFSLEVQGLSGYNKKTLGLLATITTEEPLGMNKREKSKAEITLRMMLWERQKNSLIWIELLFSREIPLPLWSSQLLTHGVQKLLISMEQELAP